MNTMNIKYYVVKIFTKVLKSKPVFLGILKTRC